MIPDNLMNAHRSRFEDGGWLYICTFPPNEVVVKIGISAAVNSRTNSIGGVLVCAFFLTDDPVGVEQALHKELHRRVPDRVSSTETYYLTPDEAEWLVREHLAEHAPEALNFWCTADEDWMP